ncbi:hypothetical protein Taro_053704 [Colocasia esculenta]|uniref:Uncharacterized protein n=1 Tax=Colocasia esculenta TaxID=4460 RepID=A0A843XNK4_COLES|nr:hypothetical protein [Colocasia esculenta]
MDTVLHAEVRCQVLASPLMSSVFPSRCATLGSTKLLVLWLCMGCVSWSNNEDDLAFPMFPSPYGWLATFSDLSGVPVSRAVSCVLALVDGPSGGFRKGCRACLCLLGFSLGYECARVDSLVSQTLVLRGKRWWIVAWCRLWSSLSWVCVSEVVVVLFRCGPASPSHCLPLRWFRSRVGRLGMGPQLGRAAVVGCVVFCCGSLAALYLGRCCFHIVFDSAGSVGVVFDPTLVVGRGITLFRCFVVLCSTCFPLYYFVE